MMKTRLSLVSMLASLGLAGAQDQPPEPKWNVTAEFRMVVLPQKDALEMLPELLDAARIEGAQKTLIAMIRNGKAALQSNFVIQGEDGEQLAAESGETMRYPTEFSPPDLPKDIPVKDGEKLLKAWPLVGVTPTAFESQTVGATVKFTAKVSEDGSWVQVNADVLHRRFLGWKAFDAGKLPTGDRIAIEQPQFHTIHSNAQTRLASGQWVLLGFHTLLDGKSVELILFRVSTLKAPSSK